MVIEVLYEEATVNEITAKYGIQSAMLGRWKQEFIERASDVFKKEALRSRIYCSQGVRH
ncbi:MAG: hypothetical protein RJR35_09270 [Thermoanaerobacterales bacterium]|nr:hypothetical protein [Thermoanaerobacterales bacterium]